MLLKCLVLKYFRRDFRIAYFIFQVSQLAEDRGYLNTQLAHLSKSLREKEQEWLAMRQQYAQIYQAYISLQAKVWYPTTNCFNYSDKNVYISFKSNFNDNQALASII